MIITKNTFLSKAFNASSNIANSLLQHSKRKSIEVVVIMHIGRYCGLKESTIDN